MPGEPLTSAPIALFAYNRPWHTRQTVEALARNARASDSHLLVYSDGAKSASDAVAVEEVREYLRTITGFRHVTVIERDRNLGLAESIVSGVTEVVNAHGRVIVVEDDILTSPFFLAFMNDALALYEADERVISISGYLYPMGEVHANTFFLKGADCWGWATWRRGWALFEPDGSALLDELEKRRLQRDFDYGGGYPYTKMLRDQTRGLNDSWAIRWHASAFLRDKLTLYPARSLVHNIGHDGSGTHSQQPTDIHDTALTDHPVNVDAIPVEEHGEMRRRLAQHLGRQRGFHRRVRRLLGRQT